MMQSTVFYKTLQLFMCFICYMKANLFCNLPTFWVTDWVEEIVLYILFYLKYLLYWLARTFQMLRIKMLLWYWTCGEVLWFNWFSILPFPGINQSYNGKLNGLAYLSSALVCLPALADGKPSSLPPFWTDAMMKYFHN